MTPFYLDCCKELSWPVDQNLVNKMKLANEEKLKVNFCFKKISIINIYE